MWHALVSIVRRAPRPLVWLGGVLAGVLVVAYAGAPSVEEPVRRSIERAMNARLRGYTVRLGRADLHPLRFAVDLRDLTIVQDANPDPPVMRIARLGASVQWRALLRGHLMGDARIERPVVHVNLRHLRREVEEAVPLHQRGWQDALQAAYPLTLDALEIVDGEVTYIDDGPFRPLRVHRLEAHVENIRNVRSRERTYPSELRLRALVFDTGRLAVDGSADFLAAPHPGVRARLTLTDMAMDYFQPVTRRYNLTVSGGRLAAEGQLEYAPAFKAAVLDKVVVRGARVDYVHSSRTARAERAVATQTAQAARAVRNRSDVELRLDRLDVLDATVGLVNEAARPPYRLFLSQADVRVRNLSSRDAQGPAEAQLEGRFMGSGTTRVTAAFRPGQARAHMSLHVAMEGTDAPALNDLLRAHYRDLDVSGGTVSLYSEVRVDGDAIRGYVKPLVKGLVVYDPTRDRDKPWSRRVYERLVGTAARALENSPRREVATRAELSGRVGDPRTSVWQIVGGLLRNAFVEAIRPGFDAAPARPRGSAPAVPGRGRAMNRDG